MISIEMTLEDVHIKATANEKGEFEVELNSWIDNAKGKVNLTAEELVESVRRALMDDSALDGEAIDFIPSTLDEKMNKLDPSLRFFP